MTRERDDDEEPPLMPVFDTDLQLRRGYWGAYVIAGMLMVMGIVGLVRASWLWVFPILLAIVAVVANFRARRALTYPQVFLWLLLVGVGVFGGSGLCLALMKRGFS